MDPEPLTGIAALFGAVDVSGLSTNVSNSDDCVDWSEPAVPRSPPHRACSRYLCKIEIPTNKTDNVYKTLSVLSLQIFSNLCSKCSL